MLSIEVQRSQITQRNMNGRSTLLAVTILLAVVVLFPPTTHALDRLRVTVGDTCGLAGSELTVTTFLTNMQDDIYAFRLHIVLDRNDIAYFQTEIDTIEVFTYWRCFPNIEYPDNECWDSVEVLDPLTEPYDRVHVDTIEAYIGDIDTTGTLISGWDYVKARAVSTGELGLDMLVTAICDTDSIPGYVPPISPQGGGALFRIPANILPIPIEQEDRTAHVNIDTASMRWFGFSTPEGESIGWITIQVPDTNFYMCTQPQLPPGTGCYEWTRVYQWECPEGECDSVYIYSKQVIVLDKTQVSLWDGTICVFGTCCSGRVGDANNLGGDEPTIGDVSVLIDVLFINADWDAIACLAEADVNQSGGADPTRDDITIGDVSILIDYLFIEGPFLGLPACL